MSRYESLVVDAKTSEVLDGPPTPGLWLGEGVQFAYWNRSHCEWCVALPGDVAWMRDMGWEVREVRVVTPREAVLGAIEWLCNLLREADERRDAKDEAAYGRQVERFYGSDSPQTVNEQLEACRG